MLFHAKLCVVVVGLLDQWKLQQTLFHLFFVRNDFVWVGSWEGYDEFCCPASPKLLLGLDLGLGCDNIDCNSAQQKESIAKYHGNVVNFSSAYKFVNCSNAYTSQ